jgi:transposase-like protein
MTPKNNTKKLRKSAEQWILDRSTLRRIEEKTEVHYSAKWRQAQKYADSIPSPIEHFQKNKDQASQIVLMDAKYVRIRDKSVCIHIAYDTGIGVIHYWIDETENKTAYHFLLRELRKVGYEPICAVSDEHWSLVPLFRELRIPHQLCIFHLLQSLRRIMTRTGNPYADIPAEFKVMFSRIKGILKTSCIEDLPARVQTFRKLIPNWTTRKYKRVLKWFWNILPRATIGLCFEEEVPRTSNLLENINGQIEQRLKTFRGVKSEESLKKILKILFYFRNYK